MIPDEKKKLWPGQDEEGDVAVPDCVLGRPEDGFVRRHREGEEEEEDDGELQGRQLFREVEVAGRSQSGGSGVHGLCDGRPEPHIYGEDDLRFS